MNAVALVEVIANSKKILSRLKLKYPDLDAYLVFSSRFGQTQLTHDPLVILREFPAMFVPSPDRDGVLAWLAELKDLRKEAESAPDKDKEKILKKIATLDDELQWRAVSLEIAGDTQVELRFGNLNYSLIEQLQKDPMVDISLTPQTRASIRIVLATVESMQKWKE